METLALLPHANQLVNAIHHDDPLPLSCISEEKVNALTIPTRLDDFQNHISEAGGGYNEAVCCLPLPLHQPLTLNNKPQVHKAIVWIEASLRNPHGIDTDQEPEEAATQIQEFVIAALTPPAFFALKSPYDYSKPSPSLTLVS